MAILSIQSTVAYGCVGNRAAVFVLERLGHEVWELDTVSFSNHPAHGGFRGRVTPAGEVAELLAGVEERGVLARCDAVLSGYLGSAATAEVVRDAVTRVKASNPRAVYCCDPVMGETGRGFYVSAGIPEAIRGALVPGADVVTPNPFELEHLGGVPPETLAGALRAADAVRRLGPGLVVATGLRFAEAPGLVAVLAVDGQGAWIARAPRREVAAHGAGDAFAALFLGVLLRGRDVPVALGHAVGALDGVLAQTEADGLRELALVAAQDRVARPGAISVERVR